LEFLVMAGNRPMPEVGPVVKGGGGGEEREEC
jgi:hypothetical protein